MGRKGGRKPSLTPPKNKRAAQLRASQNAFRKRKLERLEELEKKEAQLTVTNDQIHILKKENELLHFMLRSLLTERNMPSDERNISKACCEENRLHVTPSMVMWFFPPHIIPLKYNNATYFSSNCSQCVLERIVQCRHR